MKIETLIQRGSRLLVLTMLVGACSDQRISALYSSSKGVRGGQNAFTFVVVGCNRVDASDVSSENPSTANLEQLNRTFQEIAALDPLPTFLFFAGDMVFGYNDDPAEIERQLTAWRAVYEASPLPKAGVELVAIPGNHEVQGGGSPHLAYGAAEEGWLRVMAPYIRGSNGPGPGGKDELMTDQSQLTYSFDYLGTHFVLLDTDPVGKDWQVPYRWVGDDVQAAREKGTRHIFAIGHKPAYPSPLTPDDGLVRVIDARDAFWQALENNQAEAMFSAHNHLWLKQQPHPGRTWQIIAGNGGSRLEAGVTGDDAYYGFTVVNVRYDVVSVASFGRDVPTEGYLERSDAYPTSIRNEADITWKQ